MKKIIVDMDGRLGNQMFQYAYALKLKKKFQRVKLLLISIEFRFMEI
ncbi:hypothetical protein ICE98_03779 [Lactococcus lactis]|nr:hypothetical protein [Lactococcus lactis]